MDASQSRTAARGAPHAVRHAAKEAARRRRQAVALLRNEGPKGALARVLTASARKLTPPALVTGIDDAAILASDLRSVRPNERPVVPPGRPLVINWVIAPPSVGSGGHTTMFRIIRHLQSLGHDCRVYLYDFYGSDIVHFRTIIHEHYADPSTAVRDVRHGMADADAVFATCWETAYVANNDAAAGRRFYFVQDLESMFYAPGGAATLAENTYRMGFHGITAGAWLSRVLRDRYGMEADHFDFGCDAASYTLQDQRRDGVVFYARPSAPRRAFELGVLALRLFSASHPEIRIHCYGDRLDSPGFECINHGHVDVPTLNALYNRCFAGLSLSMTNVSLVPWEMLAAGCVPVVNDAEHNRIVLANDFVQYASADPHSLAAALSRVVTMPDYPSFARDAAASVGTSSWERAGQQVADALERSLRGKTEMTSGDRSQLVNANGHGHA